MSNPAKPACWSPSQCSTSPRAKRLACRCVALLGVMSILFVPASSSSSAQNQIARQLKDYLEMVNSCLLMAPDDARSTQTRATASPGCPGTACRVAPSNRQLANRLPCIIAPAIPCNHAPAGSLANTKLLAAGGV